MKVLTAVVPCYNSESYMRRCIDSLLKGGDYMEIIIVDDGSTDGTAEIADEYQNNYPHIVTAIHQQNKGHGGAINTGISAAHGYYFKVVDSDDWVDEECLITILCFLNDVLRSGKKLDMLLSNYVYEKKGADHKYVMKPKGLPKNRFFTWDDVGHIRKYHYILMHSVIYKTEILRKCGIKLPEHTFYVDNLYVFEPLPYIESIYYMDIDFYRYFIGRDDQSVNTNVMLSRIDQQYKVNELMFQYFCRTEIPHRACRRYMMNYVEVVTAISCALSDLEDNPYRRKMQRNLWITLREKDIKLYMRLRWRASSFWLNLPGDRGRRIGGWIYRKANKLIGFS